LARGAGNALAVCRSVFDALVALEFSVKDTSEFGTNAQQLEPALGQLTEDIRTAFRHVAGCIHEWRFHVPPPMNLEEDIAQLEARMTAVRPLGIEFSQAEILRAMRCSFISSR